MKENSYMIKEVAMLRWLRLRMIRFPVTSFLLLVAASAFAQQTAPPPTGAPSNNGNSAPSEVTQSKTVFKSKEVILLQSVEKKIDQTVADAVQAYQKDEFDKAIDLYLDAKKRLETLYESHPLPRLRTKIDNCTLAISKAYYYWAQKIYFEAEKSAKAADFDQAIDKCEKAIRIYPPCKEKMEKIIAQYRLMKENAQVKEKVAEANPNPQDQYDKRVLIRQGQMLYNTEQWDKARTKFEEVISIDPYNETAVDYIRKINLKLLEVAELRTGVTRNTRNAQAQWEMVTPLVRQDVTSSSNIPESGVSKSSNNDRIIKKLKDIIIDKISFEEVSIATAVRYLRQCSKEKDPEKIGINFVLRGKINQPLSPEGETLAVGEGGAARKQGGEGNESSDVEPLTMMLDNIPLETVVKYICNQANLKYRIDDNAVIIASKDVPLDDVQTKVYPVEKSAIKLREGERIQDFFTERGMTFDAGASVVYKEYIGRLIVTNTPRELQTLENILREMNTVDPQVLIQTKFVEVKLNDLEELGFKYELSRSNANIAYASATDSSLVAVAPGTSFTSPTISNVYTTNTTDVNWLDYSSTVGANKTFTNTSSSTVYYTKAPLQKSSTSYTIGGADLIRTFSNAGTLENNTTYGEATSFSSYNSGGYKISASLYALDQSDSADVLSCPRVTTMSDSPATIQLVTEKYYPSQWDEAEYTIMGNNVPVFTGSVPNLDEETQEGITLTVTPMVDPDNYTISLLMRPLIRKFTGWDDYSYTIPMRLNDNSPTVNVPNTMIMPRFEQRTVDTSVECTDNGTIVMGGMIRDEVSIVDDQYPVLGDLPLIGRFFQSKGRDSAKYNLLIFLSCRLVNPDGSPLREREDRGIPPFKN